ISSSEPVGYFSLECGERWLFGQVKFLGPFRSSVQKFRSISATSSWTRNILLDSSSPCSPGFNECKNVQFYAVDHSGGPITSSSPLITLFCFGIRLFLLCPVLTTPSSPCFDQWNTLGGPSSSFPSISITRAKIWPFLKNQTSDPLANFCGVLGYAGRVE
ncbi:hypothetical protein BJ912DRAFT_1002727, partial [Pholiota molesta]